MNLNSKLVVNPFVSYLNSLQRSGGSNENALAESQACNKLFATIHVPHSLADVIENELTTTDGRHVILTGHAGDGKSTVALDLFKRFRGMHSDEPLEAAPRDREDADNISIIKDLSERDKQNDKELFAELLKNDRHFLLVSNTGTLLDFFKGNSNQLNEDPINLESKVLDSISKESGEDLLDLGSRGFRIFNLARMDNLGLARKIFEKMLEPERWSSCEECICRQSCPIRLNVELLGHNQTMVLDRIFLAYRRMYEYGTRLTMRQITEHLAYMITSGLDEGEVHQIYQQNRNQIITDYLFFNNFFGDNGTDPIPNAQAMQAIQEIQKQEFGQRPSPRWERRLWLKNENTSVSLEVDLLKSLFDTTRKEGSQGVSSGELFSSMKREQIRRMLFFFYSFDKDEEYYLSQYLNSPTLLDWYGWQNEETTLDFEKKAALERKIYHVLQEHFTGVRLPEGAAISERRLYITLSRRQNQVRQSAQIVLAQVDWSSSTALKLQKTINAIGDTRKDLVLSGQERIEGINLILKVPFLDYVMMRHFGELGEVLDASYIERLNRYKTHIQTKTSTSEDNRIILVRLKTDHTFRRQSYSIKDNRLEVTDVF